MRLMIGLLNPSPVTVTCMPSECHLMVNGGETEMSDAIRAGVPAIKLMGLTRENVLPYWHQTVDTVDKIDVVVLDRNYDFTWHYYQALDQQAS
jgi:hypothetical protein